MKIYKNPTNGAIEITIPVEFDKQGNPTRYKTHNLKSFEVIQFNDQLRNTNTIIEECLTKNLTKQ